MKHIVTHPGAAHRDELLSVAIALSYQNNAVVYRREPASEELQDSDVLVLDVGGEYNPELSNFDHHQRGRDESPECALSLYVEALGLLDAFKLQQWFEPSVLMDVCGPFQTASKLGLSRFPFELLSPVEKFLLDEFEERDEIHPDELIHQLLRKLGQGLVKSALEYQERYHLVLGCVSAVMIGGVQTLIVKTADTQPLQQIRDREFPEAGISLSWDDRGDGWACYRFNDHRCVDFSVLEGDSAVLFAHKGGFIAKTHKRLEQDELVALVQRAVFTLARDFMQA